MLSASTRKDESKMDDVAELKNEVRALRTELSSLQRALERFGMALNATRKQAGLSHLREYDEQDLLINSRVRDRAS